MATSMPSITFVHKPETLSLIVCNMAEMPDKKMAERTGLEPATPGVTGRYSNQLNYRSARN